MNTKTVKTKINEMNLEEVVSWLKENGVDMLIQSPEFISQEAVLSYYLEDGGKIELTVELNEEYKDLLEKVIDGDTPLLERAGNERVLRDLQSEIKYGGQEVKRYYEDLVSIEVTELKI